MQTTRLWLLLRGVCYCWFLLAAMATTADPSTASAGGKRKIGERTCSKLWEQKAITLFVQDSANCTVALELLGARTDTLPDMVKIVHVNTLTRETVPPFLAGVPTIYFRDLDPSERLFEGDSVLTLLRTLPQLEEPKQKFRGVALGNFGIGRGRRSTTCSTVQLCDMRSSQPINNRDMQRRGTRARILQAQLQGTYARTGDKVRTGMTMKERISLLNAQRQQSEARIAQLQAQYRAAHSSRNFLEAAKATAPTAT